MTDREWDLYIHGKDLSTIKVVEYRSAEYNALVAAGYALKETWTGSDGVIWARMEAA